MSNNPFLPGQAYSYPALDAFDAGSRYPVIETSTPGGSSQTPYMNPQQFGYSQPPITQLQQQWQQSPQRDAPQQQQTYQPSSISSGYSTSPSFQTQYQQFPMQLQQQQQQQQQQPQYTQNQTSSNYQFANQSSAFNMGQQQQYQQPQQQATYSYQQQQQPPSQEILYLFDPHTSAASAPTASAGGANRMHPKGYLSANKIRLEAWDKTVWTDFLATFETLKNAWQREASNNRNNDIQRNDAANLASDVAASHIQMIEGYQGYKVSRDPASKSRVRSAMNAALADLPDFPPGFM